MAVDGIEAAVLGTGAASVANAEAIAAKTLLRSEPGSSAGLPPRRASSNVPKARA
jgi:hypothetical protein